jgi:hypothetical protein
MPVFRIPRITEGNWLHPYGYSHASASLWIGKFGTELTTKEADARKAFT